MGMNLEKLLEFINREVPAHAEEVWSAIDMLAKIIKILQLSTEYIDTR